MDINISLKLLVRFYKQAFYTKQAKTFSTTNMDIAMTTLPFSPKVLSVAILTTLLAACGGGSSDSGSSAPTTSTISGTATKGTLKNAVVTAYKIKDDGSKGEKITDTKTDANGKYTLTVTGYTGPVLLELTTDTNTKMACDIAKGCVTGTGASVAFGNDVNVDGLALRSVLSSAQGGIINSAITPFTHMATEFAIAKSGGLKKANIESALSQVQQLFDLPDLQNTALPDATKPLPADLDVQRYALLNAAIGQLASNVNDIRPQIDAIVTQLKSNNGQLKSSETTGTDNIKDLADVLKAAQTVAESNKLSGLNSLIKAAVKEHLQEALATTGNTNIQPTDNAGATDLNKAKSFVTSIKQMVNKAEDLKSLESSLVDKTKTVDNLTGSNAEYMFSFGLTATTFVLEEAIVNAETTNGATTLNAAAIQQLSNTGAVSFLNGTTITIDKINRKATMNGSLQVTRVGATPIKIDIKDLIVTYPAIKTAQTSFELKLMPNASIASPDIKLSINGTGSNIKLTSSTPLIIDSDSFKPTAYTALISFDKVTLEAIKAPANEIGKFVGSINADISEKILTTNIGTRPFPILNKLGLMGAFSAANGDMIEAGLTLDTTGSNPKVSPAEGSERTGLFSYSYNATTDTATLKANSGVFNPYWNPTNTLTITEQNGCLMMNTQQYLGCYEVNNVADGLLAFMDSEYMSWGGWALRAYLKDEGDYLPMFSNDFNFKSNVTIKGVLDYSDDYYSEDATHFAKATLSLSTKVKLGTQEASANITAKRTGYGTNGKDGSGEFMADIIIGTEKLSLKAPVVGGKATYTLTNKDNVSVDVNSLEGQDKIEIKVAGKVAGWIYRINGLPVAKFTDNSLMAL